MVKNAICPVRWEPFQSAGRSAAAAAASSQSTNHPTDQSSSARRTAIDFFLLRRISLSVNQNRANIGGLHRIKGDRTPTKTYQLTQPIRVQHKTARYTPSSLPPPLRPPALPSPPRGWFSAFRLPYVCCNDLILEPQGGNARSVSPGLEEASGLYRERETLPLSSSGSTSRLQQ